MELHTRHSGPDPLSQDLTVRVFSFKEFLTVNVQTRRGPGQIYTLAQSIGFNNIDNEPSLRVRRESLKREDLICMSGSCLTDEGRANFTRGDFDTSVGG